MSNIDYDVAAMSNEEAYKFMDEFLSGTPDKLDSQIGKVLKVKGQVSRYTKKDDSGEHVSFSVGPKGEGGSIKAVCVYVEGWGANDMPQNKATVTVTGVYDKVDGYGNAAGRTLICNAEDVIVE